MATLDSLPGDQRAVLQLVLGRGRSYDEIARLLAIDPAAVRERALAALDALGPATQLTTESRLLICDYLLGQLPQDAAAGARELIDHPVERTWAQALVGELAPLAAGPLPEVPLDAQAPIPAATAPPPDPVPVAPVAPAPAPPVIATAPPAPEPVASSGPPPRSPEPATPPVEAVKRTSRRGGAIVIAAVVLIIAAVVVVYTRDHHSGHSATKNASATVQQTDPASASQTATSASTSASTGTRVISQINLSAASTSAGKAAAIAEVLQEGTGREVAIVGQNVPANTSHNSYEVWLYNSQKDAVSLGFVNPGVSSTGKLSAAGPLPTDAAHYRRLIITLETTAKPKVPGPIVLQGTISGL